MSAPLPSFWVVIPAAGSGRRMGSTAVPKQYLRLGDRSVIEHAVAPFIDHPACRGLVVVLSAQDERWSTLSISTHIQIRTTIGGVERVDSVRAGLDALSTIADPSDWVLVHDAARPCLDRGDLERLLIEVADDEVGGLLAAPVVDTLKRADDSRRVRETTERAKLWRALTPQMFRLETLLRALDAVRTRGVPTTDESQAVESLGLRPKLVAGNADNIKITLQEDVVRAERILWSRNNS